MGSRHLEPFQAQALQVERDRLLHVSFDLLARSAGRDTTFQIRRVRGVSSCGFFANDKVFLHFFIPACFNMLFKVKDRLGLLRSQCGSAVQRRAAQPAVKQ